MQPCGHHTRPGHVQRYVAVATNNIQGMVVVGANNPALKASDLGRGPR